MNPAKLTTVKQEIEYFGAFGVNRLKWTGVVYFQSDNYNSCLL